MNTGKFRGPARGLRGALALLALWLTTPALTKEPEAAKRARALIEAPLVFKAYVFAEGQAPACDFADPRKAAELLGPYSIRTTLHDADFQPVGMATKPGLYGAVVDIVPRQGTSLRRFVTLYRVPGRIEATRRLDPAAPETARLVGIPADVLRTQAELIGKQLQGHAFADLAGRPEVARLLAGVSLSPAGKGPVHRYDDAYARERQWWVAMKRREYRQERRFRRQVDRPLMADGAAATVVREGTAEEAGMKPDAAARIDAVCRAWAADDDQAFAICIVRHGVIVLHKAYGTRDGKPMTVTTKSWMASITKTMSATCMMMLVDQGLVDLDDSVEKYLPALRGLDGGHLTLRHLYTHTSGLAAWPAVLYHDDLPDIEERVALAYPFLEVGKTWAYGGQGYTLGGKIIEAVSGEAMPAFYHRHLLSPLGCEHTDVTGTHADAFSVPLDMARFGQMLLNGGAYGRSRFLKEETFARMLPHKLTEVLGPKTTKVFGVGLDGTARKFGHGAASAATFQIDRDRDMVVIMTRNKMGKNQEKYNGKFHQAIEEGLAEPASGGRRPR